jgi:hypothetical protein
MAIRISQFAVAGLVAARCLTGSVAAQAPAPDAAILLSSLTAERASVPGLRFDMEVATSRGVGNPASDVRLESWCFTDSAFRVARDGVRRYADGTARSTHDAFFFDGQTAVSVADGEGVVSVLPSKVGFPSADLSSDLNFALLRWPMTSMLGAGGGDDLLEILASGRATVRPFLDDQSMGSPCAVLDVAAEAVNGQPEGPIMHSIWLDQEHGWAIRRVIIWRGASGFATGSMFTEILVPELCVDPIGVALPARVISVRHAIVPGTLDPEGATEPAVREYRSLPGQPPRVIAQIDDLWQVAEGSTMTDLDSGESWIARGTARDAALALLADHPDLDLVQTRPATDRARTTPFVAALFWSACAGLLSFAIARIPVRVLRR